ncbi:hypothetical protein ILUMI_03095, partial [Ignelater luminosus]
RISLELFSTRIGINKSTKEKANSSTQKRANGLSAKFYHCKPDRINKMAQTSNESDSFELNADIYKIIKRSAAFKKLTIKRGQLRGELTRFFNFVAELNAKEKTIAQLKSRMSTIQYVLQDFDKTQAEIDGMLLIYDKSAFDHEDKFHEANGQANEIIHASAQGNISVCSDSASNRSRPAAVVIESNPSQQLTAKLPLLTLPEFSGSHHEWQRFHGSIQALIHNKTSLTNVEKFYYLLGVLK